MASSSKSPEYIALIIEQKKSVHIDTLQYLTRGFHDDQALRLHWTISRSRYYQSSSGWINSNKPQTMSLLLCKSKLRKCCCFAVYLCITGLLPQSINSNLTWLFFKDDGGGHSEIQCMCWSTGILLGWVSWSWSFPQWARILYVIVVGITYQIDFTGKAKPSVHMEGYNV